MGTATFDIGKYGKNRGLGAGNVIGELVTSGEHTTTTTVSNLTDGAAGSGSAITAVKGDVLHIAGDETMRVAFAGAAATATSGHVVTDTYRDIEIPESGAISIIDVA